MRGSRLLALSLGLASFTGVACEKKVERPVEPRLTGGDFTYARCRTDWQAPDLVPDAVCADRPRELQLTAAGSAPIPVRGSAKPSGSADLAHRELLAVLRSGDPRFLDRAVRDLEDDTGAAPREARFWNDLAAVYLVRAERRDDPRDLVRALRAAERAVREDGALVEARFNRALALERLFLTEARQAWEEVWSAEPDSDWAREAQDHLAELDRLAEESSWDVHRERLERAARAGDAGQVVAIVRQFRQEAREHGELTLLGEWAKALDQGDAGRAADRLRVARAIGAALLRVNGDRLLGDAVVAIDRASASGQVGRLRTLVEGHLAFRDGHALYHQRGNMSVAAEKLVQAREALTRAGSPFAARAAFFLLCCDYFAGNYQRAFEGFERLAGEKPARSSPGLLGHALWMQGLCRSTLGDLAPAMDLQERSLAVYRRAGEKENAAVGMVLLSETLLLLGQGREAWEHAYRALRDASRVRNLNYRSLIFWVAADAALRDGAPEAALALQQEVVLHASQTTRLRHVEALTWLGWMQAHAGRRARALEALRQAEAELRGLDDPVQRQRREANLALVEATLIQEEEPRRAISLLTSALTIYQVEENHIFALRALRARARAHRQAGDDARAEADLWAGIAEYERLGANLGSETIRLAHLEETGEIFDEMISLQAERDPALGFAFADRARTRVLPGSASRLWTPDPAERSRLLAAALQPLPLDEIRRRLPPGVSLVQLAVLGDRVLLWRLRGDAKTLDFFSQSIPRERLEELVERFRRFELASWENASEELYDLLVRPWRAGVGEGERLVFVPDKVLHLVPFAALRDRETGSFLVEDHTIVIAPSATLYVNALGRQAGRTRAGLGRGLAVGDPAIDTGRFQTLLPLPGAAAEADRLAARTGAARLVGAAATRPVFLAEAGRAEWIHFAGHAVVDPRNPLLSSLILAPDGRGDSGLLTAREIYGLDLGGTRLVVLAACDSGREYVPGSEGVTSLARAFLAAGVPSVVASLRDVEDETTSRLFDAFHHNLRAGADPASALRAAQLALLASGDEASRSPAAWAVFETIGASAR
jgi:CHAT domain-containing protein/tetratricopeptide (TPR) repeat protein